MWMTPVTYLCKTRERKNVRTRIAFRQLFALFVPQELGVIVCFFAFRFQLFTRGTVTHENKFGHKVNGVGRRKGGRREEGREVGVGREEKMNVFLP